MCLPSWHVRMSSIFKRPSKSAKGDKRTTLLIRNLPNNMSRDTLVDLFDAQGFAGCYDFVYLPIDFQRRAGFGYAFVNCTTSANAQRMMDHFHQFSNWSTSTSTKICEVCWCQHLKDSLLRCSASGTTRSCTQAFQMSSNPLYSKTVSASPFLHRLK